MQCYLSTQLLIHPGSLSHLIPRIKVKRYLILRHLQYWTAALYNLGSGSWLALAVVPRCKLAAAYSPR